MRSLYPVTVKVDGKTAYRLRIALIYAGQTPSELLGGCIDAAARKSLRQNRAKLPPGFDVDNVPSHWRAKAPHAGVSCVYLIQMGSVFKIGCTKDAEQRARHIGSHSPQKVSLIHVIAAKEHHAAERGAHHLFRHCRFRGEWFRLTKREVAKFKRLRLSQLMAASHHKTGAGF